MTAKKPDFPPRPRLVLRVGITGHRPAPGREFVTKAIEAALDEIFREAYSALCMEENAAYDRTLPRMFTLISALAEGADQMAAAAFLRLKEEKGNENIGVHAILPFSESDYAKTMETSDAEAMRTLLKKSERRLVLGDFRPPARDSEDKTARFRMNRRYHTVGKMVVHQCDFLVAIWNGQPSEGLGGTGDIVIHAVNEGVPVIWVDLTGRRHIIMAGNVLGDPLCTIAQRSRPFTEGHFMLILKRALLRDLQHSVHLEKKPYKLLDYFKEEVPRTTPWIPYQRVLAAIGKRAVLRQDSKKERLVPSSKPSRLWVLETDYVGQSTTGDWPGFPFRPQSSEQIRLAGEWAAADAIATALGHAYRSTYLLVMMLSFFAVFVGLCGIAFVEHRLALVELLLIGAAIGLHFLGQRRSLHEKWIHSREIAERLRASWAAMLLGGGGRRQSRHNRESWGAQLCDAYLAEAGVPDFVISHDSLVQIARAALEGIAKEQQRYHAGNNKLQLAIHHRLETYGKWTLYIAIGVAILLFLLVLGDKSITDRWKEMTGTMKLTIDAMGAICVLLPTLGATLAALKYQGDFERFSIRSRETSVQLMRVSAALRMFLASPKTPIARAEELPRTEFLLDIFEELEKYLLTDLEDWRSIYATRVVPEPA